MNFDLRIVFSLARGIKILMPGFSLSVLVCYFVSSPF
jgi:hypothetical protein